jgi:ADP-heptose:LPS heptosyltransferase
MRLRTKVLVDRGVGSLLIWLLLKMRRHQDRDPEIRPRRIVLLKLLGLGSIVQATPLLSALKDRYAEAQIVFVTKRGNEQLTRRISCIDETLTIDDGSLLSLLKTLVSTLRRLRAMEQTCFINLEAYSKLGIVLSALSGAKRTAGFFRNPSDMRHGRVFDSLVYFNPGAPISEVYLQLGRALGVGAFSPALAPLLTAPEDHDELELLFVRQGIDARVHSLVVVNPNASELRFERRWPAYLFAGLIDRLIEELPDARIVLIGAGAERSYVEGLYHHIQPESRDRVFNFSGSLSLGGLIALIKSAGLMITNDSGPMHFAFSVSTPTLAMFGPVAPAHYSLNADRARNAILYHRTYCGPCVHHFDDAPCHGDNVCMKRISIDEALSAALSLLRAENVERDEDARIIYIDHGRPLGVLGAVR